MIQFKFGHYKNNFEIHNSTMDHLEILPNICRVCLHIKDNKISLYKKVNGFSPYEKLMKFTKLCVKVDDGGSSWICSNCAQELDTVAEFMNKCDQTNGILYNYFNVAKDSASINCEDECEFNGNEPTDANTVNEEHDQPKESNTWKQTGIPARQECPVAGCHKSFTTKTNLLTHIRKHNGERPFTCGECGKTFRSKNTLTNHMRIHTGVKPYMCATCGKRFATNKVRAHMRTHGARSLACPQCARMFSHARALALHARTHTPPTRPHRCALCSRAYNHKQSLNKHIRKRHASPQVTELSI